MEYLYEAVVHQKDLPIKIFTHTLEHYPYHWHEDTELLLILSGACEMRIGNEPYHLVKDDLFVINTDEVHYTKSTLPEEMTQILVLQFDLSHFRSVLGEHPTPNFKITAPKTDQDHHIHNQIRSLMAKLMIDVLEHPEGYRIQVEMHMLKILSLLTQYYSDIENPNRNYQDQSDQRLLGILKYMDSNYSDANLTLNQIADAFYMNPQYLSRYFKNHIGLSLKKFLDHMRLNKSLIALQMSDQRIIDIALKYGFPDAKAYYRVFKEVLGFTPQTYRERHKLEHGIIEPMNYFNINARETFIKLNPYLNYKTTNLIDDGNVEIDDSTLYKNKSVVVYDIDLQSSATHNETHGVAHRLMTFGYAAHALRSDFREQLKTIQEEIRFEYIRFHGIFSDEMNICTRENDGSIGYHFEKIDTLFDMLLEYNIKPFLELGFMPKDLAQSEQSMFLWKANLSPPKRMKEWTDFIDAFFRHLLNRYGLEEVSKWYFEFWNEPEIKGVFWNDSDLAFFDFYKATYQTIKNISHRLKVGGFGNMFFTPDQQWLKHFTDYAHENHVFIDFYTFHVYNFTLTNSSVLDDVVKKLTEQFENIDVEKLMQTHKHQMVFGSSEQMHEKIKDITEKAHTLPFSDSENKEMWITEWNTNTNGREWIRDTAYTGAFILKTIFENDHFVDGMGYWTFTDIFEELSIPKGLFHGGFGLMALNGLKKPSYHAFSFSKQLGEEIIYGDDSVRIARKGDEYQILTHHYCHYNDLYASMDFSQVSYHNRDTVFGKPNDKIIKLNFKGLQGRYKIETQYVNAEVGSVFDGWLKIGAPDAISAGAYKSLRSLSEPGFLYQEVNWDTQNSIEIPLKPHEIRLLKLSPIY